MLAMKWPLLGFILGVITSSIYPSLVLLLGPVVLLLVAVYRAKWVWLVIAFILGSVWFNWHWLLINQQALPEDAGKSEHVMQGRISGVVDQKHKVVFDLALANTADKIKVSCYRCDLDFKQGQTWQFDLKVKPISSFHNPEGFDYRHWMLSKGYSAQAYVNLKSSQNRLINDSRFAFTNGLSDALPADKLPILRALLLGDKSGLGAERERFIRSVGLSHLFVVSGLHVGIVAGIFGLLLYWLQRPLLLLQWHYGKEVSIVAGVLFALVYAYLTGLQVPAIRAALMLLCSAVLLLQTRYLQVIHYFVFVLLMVILLQPLAFMDMGSWLSFSIVFALILGFSSSARFSWLGSLLKAQWLAFLMGGLVLLGFNQAVVPLSFLINLVLIPVVTLLVLPAAIGALFLFGLLGLDALTLVELGLSELVTQLQVFEPILSWWLPVNAHNKLLVMFAFVLLMLPGVLRYRALAIGVLFMSLWLPNVTPEKGGFQVTILDVGQGSAALIRTQNHNMVVDTGAQFLSGLTLADLVILPHLRYQNIRYLDRLHVSHEDNDHAGGQALLSEISKAVVDQSNCLTEQWWWDGVLFEQFQAQGFNRGNNGSCLLRVTSQSGQRVLFTGDIEKEAEQALIANVSDKLEADILIAPHHGSRTSSSNGFLQHVQACIVIVSAGVLNRYGHPHEQTLNKYSQRNMMIYTTANNGAVQVEFPPRQAALVVSTYRP